MIRVLARSDLDGAKRVIASCDLFPPEMLDEMAAPFLGGDAPEEFWLVEEEGGVGAVAYGAPERMTAGTFNLYLIAVHASRQGKGHGAALMRHVERKLAARGAHARPCGAVLGADGRAGCLDRRPIGSSEPAPGGHATGHLPVACDPRPTPSTTPATWRRTAGT
ncbi:GNAT family N-acetyltransferase [Leptolyngbya sp. 15MV]|nr:GNAT family N-acetyltransferase [Leptolyngbya sp. 15MV]